MFEFYKRWKNRCRLPHGKLVGQPFPENIQEIFRFSPYKTDNIGYGVHECTGCGVRMFSCCGYHMMGPNTEKTIDSFIAHEITGEDFTRFLKTEMKWYRAS